MNRKFSSVVKNFSSKFLVLALLLNIIAPPVIHAGEPPSEQQSEEKTYSRTGAAQLRFQAAKVNIQEAQAPVAEEPTAFTCDTDSPTSYHYEVCCGFCGEYEYCGTRSCPTCAELGKQGTYPDCYTPECTSCGCPGKPACPTTKIMTQCINVVDFETGNVRKVTVKGKNGKPKLKGVEFTAAYYDESQPISKENPLILFRRPQNKALRGRGKWTAYVFYPDPDNPNNIILETDRAANVLPQDKRRDIFEGNEGKDLLKDMEGKCMFKSYTPPDGMTPAEALEAIKNGDAEEYYGENDEGKDPKTFVSGVRQFERFCKTKQDMWVNNVYVPAGSDVVLTIKPTVKNDNYKSPHQFNHFHKFRFYSDGNMLNKFNSGVVNRETFVDSDQDGVADKRVNYWNERQGKNPFNLFKENPYFACDYTNNKTGRQQLSMSTDGSSNGMNSSAMAFNQLMASLWNLAANHDFAKHNKKQSRTELSYWFPGVTAEDIELALETGDVDHIRHKLNLSTEHFDADQKKLEDDLILAAIQYAHAQDARNSYLKDRMKKARLNLNSAIGTPREAVVWTENGWKKWSKLTPKERQDHMVKMRSRVAAALDDSTDPTLASLQSPHVVQLFKDFKASRNAFNDHLNSKKG